LRLSCIAAIKTSRQTVAQEMTMRFGFANSFNLATHGLIQRVAGDVTRNKDDGLLSAVVETKRWGLAWYCIRLFR
jgi:hypothetical protein